MIQPGDHTYQQCGTGNVLQQRSFFIILEHHIKIIMVAIKAAFQRRGNWCMRRKGIYRQRPAMLNLNQEIIKCDGRFGVLRGITGVNNK
jgi:hypothetical protein